MFSLGEKMSKTDDPIYNFNKTVITLCEINGISAMDDMGNFKHINTIVEEMKKRFDEEELSGK
jgi:hypothetical protein